jgi:hypothetical protein
VENNITNFREQFDKIDRRLDEHHTPHWINERDLWEVLMAMHKCVSSVVLQSKKQELELLTRAKMVGMKH